MAVVEHWRELPKCLALDITLIGVVRAKYHIRNDCDWADGLKSWDVLVPLLLGIICLVI